MSPSSPRRGWVLGIAAVGLLPVLGVAATSAAFTDAALLDLGAPGAGPGIGNPNLFDIAVEDEAGAYADAATEADAVVLSTAGSPVFSEDDPVVLVVNVANRPSSAPGDVGIELYDPDPGADDVFDALRFDVYLAGSGTPAITGATAGEVNQAGIVLEGLAPGETRVVRLEVLLGETPAIPGSSTRIGLRGSGETR